MLSVKNLKKREFYEICHHSNDVSVNDRFKGALFFSEVQGDKRLSSTPVICIGKLGDNERIFRTEDKRCYFGVSEGWGVKDGYLFSLNEEFCLEFKKPMDVNDLKDYLKDPPVPHGFVSHMALGSKISLIKEVLPALEKIK